MTSQNDESLWRACWTVWPRRLIDGGWSGGLGQMWRRKVDGKWEYRQDKETPEQRDARQY